jgi:hypothetical protein
VAFPGKSTCSSFTFSLMLENCLAAIEQGVFDTQLFVSCVFFIRGKL